MSSTSLDRKLKQAAFDGDLENVRSLITAGANVNAADEHGSGTLLNFHPEVTAYLLAHGAAPNTQTNEFGASVLAGLCYVNQIECVRLLLEHGADPNLGRVESGETPLHHGLANGADPDLVALLVKHGADVDATTRPGVVSYNFHGQTPTRGESPLHRAAAYASREVVGLLLDAGADRNLPDANGHLPYHWAGWHCRENNVVQLLCPE